MNPQFCLFDYLPNEGIEKVGNTLVTACIKYSFFMKNYKYIGKIFRKLYTFLHCSFYCERSSFKHSFPNSLSVLYIHINRT